MKYNQKIVDNKYLEIKVDYTLGGSDFGRGMEKRGYYAYITIVKKERGFTCFEPYDRCNFKIFLGQEIKRKSKKAYKAALDDLSYNIGLLEHHILERSGVELNKEVLLKTIEDAKQ